MLLTLDEVKAWLKITVDTFDDQITALMDRAQAIIERETHLYFGPPRPADEIMDGTGTTKLFLHQDPVDPDDVIVYNRPAATDTWVVVDAEDYEIDGRGLYVASRWLKGKRNFRATYEEGFEIVPGDVAQLFLDLISSRWTSRGERTDLQSERIGDYAYTRADLDQQDSWITVRNNWVRKRI
jgi:hypothetical protein